VRYSTQVKPISYLKANAVIQDVASFEQTQETLALLKLLALGARDIEAGRTKPARAVVDRLRSKASAR
jgi:PHD/YefM family antitoxin component YafN of YafNO toxin-antitoxin module